jgi:hypothetical protein
MKPDKPMTRRTTMTAEPSAGDSPGVRLIYTKHRTYALPADQAGIPVRDYFPGVELPGPLAHANVYETSDGLVAAIPEAALRENLERPPSQPTTRRGRRPGLKLNS